MGLFAQITGDDLQLIDEVSVTGMMPVDSDDSGESDVTYNDVPVTVTVPVDYSDAFGTFADAFYEYATELVPVDTGFLQSSIWSSSDDWSMAAGADADYAQYVEYGTWKMSEQPYFGPALSAAWGEAAPQFQLAVQDAYEEAEAIAMEMGLEQPDQESLGGGGGFGGFLGGLLGVVLGGIIVGMMRVLQDIMSGGNMIQYGRGGGANAVLKGGGDFDSFIEIT